MRWFIPLVFLPLVLLLASCSTVVLYDFDATTSFNRYNKFHIAQQFTQQPGEQDYASLDNTRIHTAISRALTTKGFQAAKNGSKVSSKAGPNVLLVRYAIEEVKRLQSTGFSYGFNSFQRHFGFGLSTTPQAKEIIEGKLIVELIEPQENRVIWRAISKRHLKETMSPNDRTVFINELVTEMFKNYPPEIDHE